MFPTRGRVGTNASVRRGLSKPFARSPFLLLEHDREGDGGEEQERQPRAGLPVRTGEAGSSRYAVERLARYRGILGGDALAQGHCDDWCRRYEIARLDEIEEVADGRCLDRAWANVGRW